MSMYPVSASPYARISATEYESMLKWCATTHTKLRELEQMVRHWEVKSAAQSNQPGIKSSQTWDKISLKALRETSNDIARLMSSIQASLVDKDIDSDYYKYASDELKYFSFEWENLLTGEIGNYLKEPKRFAESEDEFMIQSIKRVENSLREDEQLIRLIQHSILDTRKTVLTINELTGRTLKTVQGARFRVKSARFFQKFTTGFQCFSISFFVALAVVAVMIVSGKLF